MALVHKDDWVETGLCKEKRGWFYGLRGAQAPERTPKIQFRHTFGFCFVLRRQVQLPCPRMRFGYGPSG